MKYKISASILNADFLNLESEIEEVIDSIDEIHLDVMDGHFVNNISYGVPILKSINSKYSNITIDTHLMIENPNKYWKNFYKNGSDYIVFHYEATSHGYIILKNIKDKGINAGLSLNPGTDIDLIRPLKNYIDRLLIMTVEPGFGGQKMIPEMLKKVERARNILGRSVDIEVDGGINQNNILDLKNAGANVFVVGSYIFKAEDKNKNIFKLRELLK